MYVHMFDIVDTPFSYGRGLIICSSLWTGIFQDKRKYSAIDLKCRYYIFTLWGRYKRSLLRFHKLHVHFMVSRLKYTFSRIKIVTSYLISNLEGLYTAMPAPQSCKFQHKNSEVCHHQFCFHILWVLEQGYLQHPIIDKAIGYKF